jgi:predicted amidohydrolase
MKLNISLGQMMALPGEEEANFRKAQMMVIEAARRGSDIIVLPELWSSGGVSAEVLHLATHEDQGIFARMSGLAEEHHIGIIGSNLSLQAEGKYGNTAVYFGSDGTNLGQYTKLHLFRLMHEDRFLVPGDHLTMVEMPWGKAGISICYDLRFPELYRSYALAGAQLVFVPAAWPHPRLHHWRILLQGRAIENQMFIVACNQTGSVKNTDFFGHSCIIDPWGETIIEGGTGEMLLTAEIDMDAVQRVREKIPVYQDRNPEGYNFKI